MMMNDFLPSVFGENLMDVFSDFDRNFFRGCGNAERALYGRHAPHMMKTDVKETENGYELDVELPGMAKENIRLELNRGCLTITAEKNTVKNDEDKDGRVLRRERYSGTMRRSFYVGEFLTEEDIKAAYTDGVLHISVPKREKVQTPEKKTILIA
ncbi:MAG: Hsp20/alpha crystallin family protein [Clostridia bacterium]|nr:Hsp20/alpha crystallin family protein [Clostridia bacterium]